MGLALSLVPLLLVKVIVARYQKAAGALLTALGIGIFAVAFTLVALNLSIHFLRVASTGRLPVGISATFVGAVLTSVTIALFANRKQPKPTSDTEALEREYGSPSRTAVH